VGDSMNFIKIRDDIYNIDSIEGVYLHSTYTPQESQVKSAVIIRLHSGYMVVVAEGDRADMAVIIKNSIIPTLQSASGGCCITELPLAKVE